MALKEERYKNLAGNSGVLSYKIGADFVMVKFIDHKSYTYSYKSAGKEHVEKMKSLAREGKGLAGYITRNVRDLYDRSG